MTRSTRSTSTRATFARNSRGSTTSATAAGCASSSARRSRRCSSYIDRARRSGRRPNSRTAQQDQVVDECFQCKLCYVNCPYIPGQHEWDARLPPADDARRTGAARRRAHAALKERLTDRVLGRTDLWARSNSATAPIANTMLAHPGLRAPQGRWRRPSASAQERVLPPYAKQRFSHVVQASGGPRLLRRRGQAAQGARRVVPHVLRRVPGRRRRPRHGEGATNTTASTCSLPDRA